MWELDYKESWALKIWCFWTVVLEKTLEGPLNSKEIKQVNPKGSQFEYSLDGLMLKLNLQYFGHWCEELTHWKRLWCWERLKAGHGDDRRWDVWMALPTWWTWVWASSRSWWRTGKPGMLQSVESQRVGHDWATELNWIKYNNNLILIYSVPQNTNGIMRVHRNNFAGWNKINGNKWMNATTLNASASRTL